MTMPTHSDPTPKRARWIWRSTGLAMFAATMAVTMPAATYAQDNVSDARVRKIEAEIRALQRTVFPGGDGRFFEPQISPEGAAPTQRQTATSTTAVTDILARLDAIELQLQRLTAGNEESTNAVEILGLRVKALEEARTGALAITDVSEEGAPDETDIATDDDADADEAGDSQSATDTNLAAMTGQQEGGQSNGDAAASTAGTAGTAGTAAAPTAERLAAVQAITKPQTNDAGDDEYSYGYRLWNAGFYPEARQQLTKFVEEYPDHPRTSYGRNLLGRAFLDDGNAEDAARWFLRNYQADKTAARAPDSLLFLAESMIALGDTPRACIALAEFGETYPAVATGRLMEAYEGNRRRVTCEG